MRRLAATAAWDARLQVRQGFYLATAFVLGLWVLVWTRLPAGMELTWLLPTLVAGNLALSTFYFVGGLVLLEKAEGTIEAQVVTPLRSGEYLAAKVLTLTALSLVENLIVVALLAGSGVAVVPAVLGIVLASALYVLVGFVAVVRYGSINEYLLPSALYLGLLQIPFAPFLVRWEHPLLYLHPMQAPLVLLGAAVEPVEWWRLLYGVAYGAAWVAVAFWLARRSFARFVVARTGA